MNCEFAVVASFGHYLAHLFRDRPDVSLAIGREQSVSITWKACAAATQVQSITESYGQVMAAVTSAPALSMLNRAQVVPFGLFKIRPFPAASA